jgi:hypothetical protein
MFLQNPELLKVIMGTCLMLLSWVVFSIWKERLATVKEEERMNFLMFNVVGGSWLVAVFALCGGFYFLLQPILS